MADRGRSTISSQQQVQVTSQQIAQRRRRRKRIRLNRLEHLHRDYPDPMSQFPEIVARFDPWRRSNRSNEIAPFYLHMQRNNNGLWNTMPSSYNVTPPSQQLQPQPGAMHNGRTQFQNNSGRYVTNSFQYQNQGIMHGPSMVSNDEQILIYIRQQRLLQNYARTHSVPPVLRNQNLGNVFDRNKHLGNGFNQNQYLGNGNGFNQNRYLGNGFNQYQYMGNVFDRNQHLGNGLDRNQNLGNGLDRNQYQGNVLDRNQHLGNGLDRNQNLGSGLHWNQYLGNGLDRNQHLQNGYGIQQNQQVQLQTSVHSQMGNMGGSRMIGNAFPDYQQVGTMENPIVIPRDNPQMENFNICRPSNGTRSMENNWDPFEDILGQARVATVIANCDNNNDHNHANNAYIIPEQGQAPLEPPAFPTNSDLSSLLQDMVPKDNILEDEESLIDESFFDDLLTVPPEWPDII